MNLIKLDQARWLQSNAEDQWYGTGFEGKVPGPRRIPWWWLCDFLEAALRPLVALAHDQLHSHKVCSATMVLERNGR
jgi:hypothetical protein